MQESVSLLRYDAACHALSLAKSVDEAKDIRDKAEAIRAYARQAKNKELEIDAVEIRIRAERRLGELLNRNQFFGLPAVTSIHPFASSLAVRAQ